MYTLGIAARLLRHPQNLSCSLTNKTTKEQHFKKLTPHEPLKKHMLFTKPKEVRVMALTPTLDHQPSPVRRTSGQRH